MIKRISLRSQWVELLMRTVPAESWAENQSCGEKANGSEEGGARSPYELDLGRQVENPLKDQGRFCMEHV
jgi:hypothetical protein